MDGSPAETMEQLYQPSPAGFQGRLVLDRWFGAGLESLAGRQ